jgi:HrpA-like RNA helicase
MKALGVPLIEKFPFPTPPEGKALGAAGRLLADLGAVGGREGGREGGLTALGRGMAALPVGVRSSKMLVLGRRSMGGGRGGGREGGREGGVELVVALVAGLSERDPFVFPDGRQKEEEKKKKEEGEEEEEEEEEEGREDEEARLLRQKTGALKLERFRQWRHPTSDALARLRAVGAYTYACSKGKGRREGRREGGG